MVRRYSRHRAIVAAALLLGVSLVGCVPVPSLAPSMPSGSYSHAGPRMIATVTVNPDGSIEFDNLPRAVLFHPVDSADLDWSDSIDVVGRWTKAGQKVGEDRALDVVLPHSGAFPGAGFTLEYPTASRVFIYLSIVADSKFVFTQTASGPAS